MIDIDVKNTSTVDVLDSITTNITTNVVPTVDTTNDLQIEINRKEYSIVGDELYIPKRYEEAPQWLRDLIDTVVGTAIDLKVQDLNTLDSIFNTLIAELEVAKNTYTQSIISSNDIDERINTAITTLNSTLADADSTILDIALTRATPEEVNTIATGILSASLLNGDIKAQIDTLQSAIATLDSARALDYTALESAIAGGLEDEATARAAAVQYLDTYVGITDGTPNGTGLLADVEILQKQNDGVIETYTDIYDVMLNPQDPNTAELITTAEPYATWVSTDTTNGNADIRLAHIGDIYVKYQTTANGAKEYIASYKFVKTIVDSTSPYATDTEGFTWALIVDQASQAAFEQALNAYDLADNKRRVFTSTPYGPYDVGDLWTRDVSGSSQIWRAVLSRVSGYLESEWSQVATDDQYAIDIVNGTNQIDLSEHIDSLGWNTSINTLASDVSNINLDLAQKAIDIANLDSAITSEEAARIQAILDEEAARIADIQLRVEEEARLDGIITAEEQARVTAVSDLDAAYKEYGRIIALALSDGALTQAEQDAIAAAQIEVDAAKQRLLNIETDVSTVFNDINAINTTTTNQAILIANLDNVITAEESARIAAILAEETARISDINDRIAKEALLDSKITAEEQARIDSANELTLAYKNYTDTVKQALIDGEITQAESNAILEAQNRIDSAKTELNSTISTLENSLTTQINSINTDLTNNALSISNLDGKIDTKEAELIASINAEQLARTTAIAERISEEARLDGLITAEEQARIDSANALTLAYKNYTDTVKQALIDGEISQAEQNAILEAQARVDIARSELEGTISTLETSLNSQISSINTNVSSNALAIANIDNKIDTAEADLINKINTEEQARIDAIADRISEEARLDGLITAEEQARIDSANALTLAYQNYTDTVKQALIDGEITEAEQNAILEAQNRVNIAKSELEGIISNLETSLNTQISSINTDISSNVLEIANLDDKIDSKEAELIASINAEQLARITAITERINEEARLDGLITEEEQARIDAVAAVDIAYKEYVRIVTLSLADGVLTQAEQDAIASAQAAVDLAKQRLLDIETNVSTLFNDISNINTTTAQQALDIANLDNAITSEETARIQAVLDEETARIAAINDRITEEARLDGLITDEEAARIQAITDVEAAYKEYSRVVTLSIADGVLTPTEQALISAAATEVEAAKQRLLDIEANANAYSDSILNNFVTVTYAADLLDTRNQIDGKADTYFQGTEPYSFASLTAEEKSAKDGDVWYDTTPTNGVEAYRFSEISGWVKIEDTQTLQALSDASLAQATADGKVQNFTSEPTHPYYVGDTWMQGSTGDIYVCNTDSTDVFNQAHWVLASKYTDDSLIEGFLIDGNTKLDLTKAYVDNTTSFTDYVANEIDKEVVVYSGSNHAAQTGMKLNDIYIEKTIATASSGIAVDVINTYKYDGTSWVVIGNNDNLTALADLTDGKRSIYGGSTTPESQGYTPQERDLWIPDSVIEVVTDEVLFTGSNVFNTYTDYDGGDKYTFSATAAGYAIVSITAVDAEGGFRLGVNGTTVGIMKGPNNATVTYRFVIPVVAGTNTISLWSVSNDGGRFSDVRISSKLNGEMFIYDSYSQWAGATKYTEDLENFVGEITPQVVTLQNQVDGKIEYYYYDNPTNNPLATIASGWGEAEHGNVVYYTDTRTAYWYNSSLNNWETITDTSIYEALQDAAEAKQAADNVIVSYYAWDQTLAPSTQYKWFKDDNTLWEYNGSTWVTVEVKKDDTLTAYNDTTKDTTLYTYSGSTWVMVTPDGVVANSKAVTDLTIDLDALDQSIYGESGLQQTLQGEITDEGARVESKFAYNSNIIINGRAYSGGFGLDINGATSTGANVVDNGITYPLFNSKFWVKADEFEITNGTTGYTPFSIVGNEITFNGKVSFTNTTGVPDYVLNSDLLIKTLGVVRAYGNNTSSTITHDKINDAIRLYSPIDTRIGMAYPAFSLIGNSYTITVQYKSNTASSSGLYIGVCELDSELTAGKTHVSYLATQSAPVVQEATRTLWRGKDNAAITTEWQTATFTYTPTSSAKWASVVILNGSGMGTASLYTKPMVLSTTPVDVSGDIASNNDVFAQSLGFTSFDAMVNNAQLGKTLISGGYINTGLVRADTALANDIMSKDITYTGTITGGNQAGGGIIQSYDGSMIINLVEGSIYIA